MVRAAKNKVGETQEPTVNAHRRALRPHVLDCWMPVNEAATMQRCMPRHVPADRVGIAAAAEEEEEEDEEDEAGGNESEDEARGVPDHVTQLIDMEESQLINGEVAAMEADVIQ